MTARVEALRAHWRKQGALAAVETALDRIGFSDAYVDDLVQRVSRGFTNKSKVVKDNVWGMIEVDPSCLRLLDSPIVQRLRGIRQLGLSYLTYPSAEHSRFIHSLGMFCVVTRFLDVMTRRTFRSPPGAPYSVWTPDEKFTPVLKHAAILHDCGHFPFSHVVEQILEADKKRFKCGPLSVDDFELPVHDFLRTSSKLAECLSIAVVLTDRFKRFYNGWVNPSAGNNDVKQIAALISGTTMADGLGGVSSIISGPSIDSDKIDYINRDGRACGIPVGVDVSRLFLRSNFLDVSPKEWKRLQNLDEVPDHGEIVFVVNASGLDSIEEIVQARTALYHRVYLHQTTRNAERLLAATIQADGLGLDGSNNFRQGKFVDALELWSLNDTQLMDALDKSRVPRASSLAQRLRARDLPKRACTFSRAHLRVTMPLSEVLPDIAAEDLGLRAKSC